jgi:glycosyltransferase involved in cell wall biosynthesis
VTPGQRRLPRRVAVVPAYNEERTVVAVLTTLAPLVDELVVVDDGSTDGTRAEIQRWLPDHPNCRLLCHDVNQGMSEAYYLALTDLRRRLQADELDADDLVFTVDADGQHDLEVLETLVSITIDERLDAMLARRDLSGYPAFKRAGNWVMSTWATWWAGSPLHDVESGYRIFRLGALAHALDYYQGYKYSETVEVAVVLCRLGYRVRTTTSCGSPCSVRGPGCATPRSTWRRCHLRRGECGAVGHGSPPPRRSPRPVPRSRERAPFSPPAAAATDPTDHRCRSSVRC